MKGLNIAASIASFLSSMMAFANGDFAYGLGLLGGAGAWLLLYVSEERREEKSK